MNYMSSCYLRRRKRKPLPTAKSYAKSLCGKVAESVAHALAGCSSLAQTKVPTQAWWNFEDSVFWAPVRTLVNRRWSTTVLTGDAKTSLPEHHEWGLFWDIPSMHSTTKLEQIGSTRDLSAKRGKRTKHSSMGPWCESWSRYTMVTGGYSTHLETSLRKLLGARPRGVLERRQTSVISNTLNIARTFKISRNTSVAKRIFYWCFYVDFIQFAIILGRL